MIGEQEDEEEEDKINKEVVIITKEEVSTIEEVDKIQKVDITITETANSKTNLKDKCKVALIKLITKLLCADILIYVSSKTRFLFILLFRWPL